MSEAPAFAGVYLFVRDVAACVTFYERLGLSVQSRSDEFARMHAANGLEVEMGTSDLTRRFDPSFIEPDGRATNVLNFDYQSADDVDRMHGELVGAGYRSRVEPIDAFWRGRYASVLDPDGNVVGLHGPLGS